MSANAFDKAHYEFDELPFLTAPWRDLNLRGVALGLIRIPAGKGYTFMHSHAEQEEVYIVIDGKGCLRVDDENIDVERGDIVRVSPAAKRALQASEQETLLCICAGGVPAGYPKSENARYLIDDGVPYYDEVPPWYAGEPEIEKFNAELKERMRKSAAKRGEA